MFCPKCGTKAIEGACFCQKCGAKLITDDEPVQEPADAQQQFGSKNTRDLGTPVPESAIPTQGNTTVDVYFRGSSLTNWIGGSSDFAYNVFGRPDCGTIMDGSLHDGKKYFGYGRNIIFIIDDQIDRIGWITGAAAAIDVNGVTLDKPRTEIINLLGMPESEGPIHDEMGSSNDYYVINFAIDGIYIQIKAPNMSSNAASVMISREPHWSGFKLKEDKEPTQAFDKPGVVPPSRSADEPPPPTEQSSRTVQQTNEPQTVTPPIEQRPEAGQRTQQTNMFEHDTAVPASRNSEDIYTLLIDNIRMCPGITTAKRSKNGLVLKNGLYRHNITIVSNQAKIGSILAVPLFILYTLFVVSITLLASEFDWDLLVGHAFYWEDYYILLSVLCFFTALVVIIETLCFSKKSVSATAYVREIIEHQGIALVTSIDKSFKVTRLITSAYLMLVGVVCLICLVMT